ncbi:diacylglycerol kinase family protein [Fructilactobacillus florum]|uniref:diacylglycerol kinase family protein n=1 Tax=Fructilactobacillus florum TaxID=640331 RepID=UPI00058D72FC|nr:diacylglycerol kinase family protein [Fructilactobacillus florum]
MPMDSQNKYQTGKNKSFCQSLQHALQGLQAVFLGERNFRFHLVATVVVLILAELLHVGLEHLLWLVLACFLVLLAEVFNSTVEALVDLIVAKHYHPLAKRVKDMSAGFVLLAAVLALIVGLIVLGPPLSHFWV